jgi:hypothetical protein
MRERIEDEGRLVIKGEPILYRRTKGANYWTVLLQHLRHLRHVDLEPTL